MAKARVPNPFEDTTRMAPAPGATQPGEGNAAYLVVLAGSNVGEMYKVEKDRLIMGRADTADIRLFDEGISREHAQVVQDHGDTGVRMILEDLGSTNGTFCNGARVQRQVLAEGDKILLGSTTILKFSYQDKLDEMFQRQMSESALRDGLTKAFNKRYFNERVDGEYLAAVRSGSPLALLFLDIDHFKRINDAHGHPAGDYVLVELAKIAHGTLRNEDIFARYGGEEFAVISRATDVAEAESLAERLRRAVEEHAFTYEGKSIPVTISVGVARAPREGVGSPAELIALADETMYTAKRSGRNRVCVARV
ncbi:MAG TPA: GGDEF domain-containing protein [Polyangia bacterium]|jgi:diguanylate cyclase (GGDEF)-like protein|nr:GGDEF domain-containing protein [Polyangia bacterium]